MIATWMFGTIVFALLLSMAAFAAERALRMSGRATRIPWAVAMVVALVWPVLARVVLEPEPVILPATIITTTSASTIVARQLPELPGSWIDRVDDVLIGGWVILSALMLARLCGAVVALRRIMRKAERMKVSGAEVLVTQSLGPAVVGLWEPRVAVPDWFLGLDESLRKLVLEHELEHCRSRDPQLVWLASIGVALMPWNPGMWMLSRRLRLALEIDCDARTLRSGSGVERYGKLLLLIAQRQSSYPLASMLAESNSHLRQRIVAMQMKPMRQRAVRIALFGGAAVAAGVGACSPRIASDLTGPGNSRAPSASATKAEAERKSGSEVFYESQVEKPVAARPGSKGPEFPVMMRASGVEGTVLAMFVVDTNGAAELSTFKVVKSDHESFTNSVRDALPEMRFLPAQIGGRKVRQLVQQPFMFDLDADGVNGAPRVKSSSSVSQSGVNTLAPWETVVLRSNATEKPKAASTVPAVERPTQRPSGSPQEILNQQGIYFESQVEQPVGVAAGSVGPKFPEMLKSSGVEGVVLAQFVVDEAGAVVPGTLRILKSDHELFGEAVQAAVPGMKFTSAKIGGRAVKQMVQQPFRFSLSR